MSEQGTEPPTPGEHPIRDEDEALHKGAKGKVLGTGEEKPLDDGEGNATLSGPAPADIPAENEEQEGEQP